MRIGETRTALAAAALLAGVLVLGSGGAVRAERSCSGMLSGNLISPLPKHTVLRIHVTDASDENMAIAERFKAGLTAAGASLSDSGGVTMEFATSITGLAESSSGTGAVSPEFGVVGRIPIGKEPPVLTMSISLMDNTLAQIDWVGYVNCKVHVSDLGKVAYDLGYSIGRSIGQTFSPRQL